MSRWTIRDIQRIREARYSDGLSIPATAQKLGVSEWAVSTYAPGRPGKVSNELVRAVFVRSGLSAAKVAQDIGWLGKGRYGDGVRLRRALGLQSEAGKKDRTTGEYTWGFRRTIDAETAGLIAEACGVGAWEVMPSDDDELEAMAA